MKIAARMLGAFACAPLLAAAAGPALPGFDDLDGNGDRFIDRAESAGDAELLRHFDAADTNHDGALSREEFVLWRRNGPRLGGPTLRLPAPRLSATRR